LLPRTKGAEDFSQGIQDLYINYENRYINTVS